MNIKFDDIRTANYSIKTTNIKGKEYAEVNQRVTAFRMVYPDGFIRTEIIGLENGVCTMKAACGYTDNNGNEIVLSSGHAQEKENSSYINKTSYIENCETSAVGRALGMAGFGIDNAIASYEEVANAIKNQDSASADAEFIKLRNEISKLGVDVHGEEFIKFVTEKAKVATLDPGELDKKGLEAVNKVFKDVIKNKKKES